FAQGDQLVHRELRHYEYLREDLTVFYQKCIPAIKHGLLIHALEPVKRVYLLKKKRCAAGTLMVQSP
ncbi:MAG: hypothetical protein J6U63_06040, partial [Clostridia bacterium]|nr:hypothetical protein [Clostridia bacterium]